MLDFVEISGKIILKSGLHIGGNDSIMQIGKVDKEVIKHEHSKEPYIPGSSLKGKIRSLLEQKYGFDTIFGGETTSVECLDYDNRSRDKNKYIKQQEDIKKLKKEESLKLICKLFGDTSKNNIRKTEIGLTRSIFRDSFFSEEYKMKLLEGKLPFTEVKPENIVNNIDSHANPRFFERVVEGAQFDFSISVKIMAENEKDSLLKLLFEGLDLLEKDYLGGHGSRGSGKIKIEFDENTTKLKETIK